MAIVPPGYGNVVIGGAGGGGYATPISIGAGTGSTWASTTAQGQLKVEGKDADIFINGQSLSDWMQTVDKRLSILRPNPELLERYVALQEAYDQYKTLEALLYDEQK